MKLSIRISALFILISIISNNAHAALKTNQWYYIESQVNKLHLDVKMGNKAAKTPIWMFTPNGTKAQQWMLVDAGGGYYYIKSRLNGMYLDVRGGNKAAKTIVWTYPKNNSAAQQWKLKWAGGDYYYIQSKVSSLYLDVKGGGLVKKTPVWQYGFNKSKSQKWKMKPVSKVNVRDHRVNIRDHRSKNKNKAPVATKPNRPRPTPRPAKEIPGRYNLPDNLRPSFEEVAVWRLQLRVKTSGFENANTDSEVYVKFRSNASSVYYLDNGGDDREKNKIDIYDILDPNIKTIGDIQFIQLIIKGNDGWCVAKVELLVNGAPVPVFKKVYPNRQCLDGNSSPGPSLFISKTALRGSSTWRHSASNRAIWLPPSVIKRSTMENMVESYVGHMMNADPNMKKNDLEYGYKHGSRYVEATKKAANKLHFDLDLKSHYGIDFEVDVDFDLVINCQNNKIALKAESVKGEADIPILSSILDVFGSCLHKMNMGNFSFGNANVPFCPTIRVTNEGDVSLRL